MLKETPSCVVERCMRIDTGGRAKRLKHQSEAIKNSKFRKASNHVHVRQTNVCSDASLRLWKKRFHRFGTHKQRPEIATLAFFGRLGGWEGTISAGLLIKLVFTMGGMFLNTLRYTTKSMITTTLIVISSLQKVSTYWQRCSGSHS